MSQESDCVKTENDIDNSMYHSVQDKFGQYDKRSFRETIVNTLDINDLRSVRKSLFDILKKNNPKDDIPDGKLIERAQRENSPPADEKLADDIYVLFHYLEGDGKINDVKACISKSKRNITSGDLLKDEVLEEQATLRKITGHIEQFSDNINHSAIILGHIFEIKQQIADINRRHDKEINELQRKLTQKENDCASLKQQLNDSRDREAKVRAEIKQLKQTNDEHDSMRQLTDKILNQLQSVDDKIKNHKP